MQRKARTRREVLSISFSFTFLLITVDSALNLIPKIIADYLAEVEDHQALRIAKAQIASVIKLFEMVYGVDGALHGASVADITIGPHKSELDGFVIFDAPNLFEVGSGDEHVELVGKSRLIIVLVGPVKALVPLDVR